MIPNSEKKIHIKVQERFEATTKKQILEKKGRFLLRKIAWTMSRKVFIFNFFESAIDDYYCLHLGGIPFRFTIDSDLHDKYALCNPGIVCRQPYCITVVAVYIDQEPH